MCRPGDWGGCNNCGPRYKSPEEIAAARAAREKRDREEMPVVLAFCALLALVGAGIYVVASALGLT